MNIILSLFCLYCLCSCHTYEGEKLVSNMSQWSKWSCLIWYVCLSSSLTAFDYSAFSEGSILKRGSLMCNSKLMASLPESTRESEDMSKSRSLYIGYNVEIPRMMSCLLTRGRVV